MVCEILLVFFLNVINEATIKISHLTTEIFFSANFIGRNGFIYYVFANQDKSQYKALKMSYKSCLELIL